jgi:hypothetical protein
VVPAVDHHEHRDHHRQEVQRQADAVDADVISALDHRDPVRLGDELHLAGLVVVELRQRVHADRQRRECRQQRDRFVQLFLCLGDEQHHQHTG